MFDLREVIRSVLDNVNIDYSTKGENTTSGWTQVTCPFCGDHLNHMGISPSMGYHCWICGASGGFTYLLSVLTSTSYRAAEALIERVADELQELLPLKRVIEERKTANTVIMPRNMPQGMPPAYMKYLHSRRYGAQTVSKYKLLASPTFGDFSYRVIIPIFYQNHFVTYTARDITGRQDPPYKNLPIERSARSIKDCIYGIDEINPKLPVLVVEGATDRWRMGGNTVATLGIDFTSEQVKVLCFRGIRELHILLDGENRAIRKAEQLAGAVAPYIPSVNVLDLGDDRDPDSFTKPEVEEVWKMIHQKTESKTPSTLSI